MSTGALGLGGYGSESDEDAPSRSARGHGAGPPPGAAAAMQQDDVSNGEAGVEDSAAENASSQSPFCVARLFCCLQNLLPPSRLQGVLVSPSQRNSPLSLMKSLMPSWQVQ
jgi:hypothetical protein